MQTLETATSNWVHAGFGLALIAAGAWLLVSRTRRTGKRAAPSSVPSFTASQRALPVHPASRLYRLTATAGALAVIEGKCGFSREHFQRSVPPLLNVYAEFVQMLPAADSARDALPRGLLNRALEVVNLALTFRRGQILPAGAAPEDIMRLEHRWTYAVLVASLLHDIGRQIAELRVTLHGPDLLAPKIWTPLAGPMQECGATRYRVDFAGKDERDEELYRKLPTLIFQRGVPADVIRWLAADSELMSELMAILSGDEAARGGAINELVLRAEGNLAQRYGPPAFGETGTPAVAAHQMTLPDAADASTTCKNETAVRASVGPSSDDGVGTPRSNALSRDSREYLEDVVASADFKSKMVANPAGVLAAEFDKAPPDAAGRFMSWLQAGLADGTLAFNQPGALVHFVREGMLLASPRIFQRFAKAFGEDGRGPVTLGGWKKEDLGKGIQRQLLKAGWHLRAEKGSNMLTYQLLRDRKPPMQISGVVIANPERFVSPVPPAIPHLVKIPM